MQSKQLKAAQEFQNSIISKCWEDSEFKARLVANPIEAIETFTGNPTNFPEGKKLVGWIKVKIKMFFILTFLLNQT